MRQNKIKQNGTNGTSFPWDGNGIVIVDGNFRPIALDFGAEAILAEMNDGAVSNGHPILPPIMLDLLEARSAHDSDGAPAPITAGQQVYSCRVLALKSQNGSSAQRMLALYLKREISIGEVVQQLSLDYHLTDREQEALIGVSMGLTSKELALRMNISPNTVKAYLRLIMIKMGTTTRAGVVGKLLDQNGRLSAVGFAAAG